MAHSFRFLAPVVCALPLVACAGMGSEKTAESGADLRGITQDEALKELSQIGDAIRAYYGPLEYKKQRFGFDLDAALAKAKTEIQSGQNEADRVRPVYELLASLHDGHVSYEYPLQGDQTGSVSLAMLVSPIEDQYVVTAVGQNLGVKKGDTLVSIDGMTPAQMASLLDPLDQVATPESTKHYTAMNMTFRPFYAPKELQPRGANAHVVLKHADGSQYTVDLPWRAEQGGLAGQIQPPQQTTQPGGNPSPAVPTTGTFSKRLNYLLAKRSELASTVLDQGSSQPWYLTPQVRQQYGVVEVNPKASTLTPLGVTVPATDATAPDASRYIQLRAYKYKYAGKTVLLVRIPQFIVPQNNYDENVAWLAGLLQENLAAPHPGSSLADMPADVVVIDDTSNPGGQVAFVEGLVSLFATAPIPNIVMAHHADRKWINNYLSAANQSDAAEQPVWLDRMHQVESAYDANKWLTGFFPFSGYYQGPKVAASADADTGANTIKPHPQVQWNRPVLVLHDELSGSGGDVFPALLQAGHVAKTFGARTMGLGGTVEAVITLPFSNAALHLTRGLMGPYAGGADPKLIENEGVTPDYPYALTVADYRAGYVGYMKAFNDVATTITR